MELDINTDWVSAYTYVNENPDDPASPIVGRQAPRRHVTRRRPLPPAGERDFFAFFADAKYPPPPAPVTTTLPVTIALAGT